MKTTLHWALFLLLAAPPLALGEDAPKKLAVVPFAALTGDVPQRAGAKAAGMLSTELRNTEKVQLVELKHSAGADPYQDGLTKARTLVGEAKELRAKRKFRLAESTLNEALGEYRSAAAGLGEVGELVDAYALLSAVQYNTGRDEEGQASLRTALSLAPARELPLAKTSPMFSRVVADARKALVQGPKGALFIDSTPANAAVAVDGVPLGSTPLLVREVPVGLHVWRVALPSGERLGGAVEVTAAKQAKVSAQTQAKDPETRMVAVLSQNRLDEQLVAAAKEHAKSADAELLLFGAISREGKGLALDSFLFTAANGELRRLPRTTFDAELLSAGMEFYNLAGKLAQTGTSLGEPVKVPGPVLSGALAAVGRASEVQYGVAESKDGLAEEGAGSEGAKESGPRAPLDPKKRAPLKKK